MQLGFVIDHSRCIGCHACTVACKAENDVPLGSFRTWVKYTERGTFPEVRRSFAVLRCNQCTAAPCVEICPVRALDKRPDGIVDVDPAACIGCKACMQGCPYDALYINESTGTAQKCHFCAHRVERDLAPACAVVCPTEAIVPGDFHDATSRVWQMRADGELAARKPEAGTGPNVLYREADAAGIDPLRTDVTGGYLWADRMPGASLDAEAFLAAERDAEDRARTTYDVDHAPLWGGKVSAYLFTKSLAAGLFLIAAMLSLRVGDAVLPWTAGAVLGGGALAFLGVTTVLLVADLKRPERFLYILRRPNWRSWLARGAVVLMAYGAAVVAWTASVTVGGSVGVVPIAVAGSVLAVLAAGYTGWLFAQSKGRVLWLRRSLWAHLVVQALVAGAAAAVLLQPLLGLGSAVLDWLRWSLIASLAVHAFFVLTEGMMAPKGREAEYARATRLVTHGPYARRHWVFGVVGGIVLPAVLLVALDATAAWSLASILVMAGIWVEEDVLVRAGQALPIS